MTVSAFTFRPTGSPDLDPAAVAQRAKSFGSIARQLKWSAIIANVEDSGTVSTFLLAEAGRKAGSAKTLAANLAATLDCAVESAPAPTLHVDGVVVTARVRREQVAGRDHAAGADPAELAKVVARTGVPGTWVSIVMRGPSRREESTLRRWMARRGAADTHFTRGGELVASNVYVHAPDKQTAADLLVQLVAAMPGLDVTCDAVTVGSGVAAWLGGSAGLAGWGAFVAGVVPQVVQTPVLAASCAATAGAHLAFSRSPRRRLVARIDKDRWPVPRQRVARVPGESDTAAANLDAWPLHPGTLMLAPHMVVGLAAPAGGAVSGERTVSSRVVAPSMRSQIGPLVGYDIDGHPCHLSADDQFAGNIAIGQPGYGKTYYTHITLAFTCAERVRPSGRPGLPGSNSGVIVFENKGDGAVESLEAARAMGDDLLLIDVADDSTPMIDLFSFPGTLAQRATRWIESARYAFGSDSMQYQSFETLQSVIPASLHLAVRTGLHPITLIHQLLCGDGNDERGKALAERVRRDVVEQVPGAEEAVVGLDLLYGPGVTPSARRTRCDAPRNKLDKLVQITAAWEPGRASVSWEDIVTHHDGVVVNLGVGLNGAQVSAEQTKMLASMMLFGLRDTIARTCAGWQKEHRYTTIVADELSDLAGDSPEILSWLREKGRSFGVRPVFATQFLTQLPEAMRESVSGFGTVAWFTPATLPAADKAVGDLSMTDPTWTTGIISALPRFHAAIRSTVGGVRQTPCIVRIGDWETRGWEGFLADQGLPAFDGTPRVVHRPWVRSAAPPSPRVELSKPRQESQEPDVPAGSDQFDPHRFF